jgi:poly(A) polymerase
MDIKFKFYKVGGCVRDEILKVKCKDIDYSVVLENFTGNMNEAYSLLCEYLSKNNYTIFLETPDCYTIRAKDNSTKLVVDFTMARKEFYPDENSRHPVVQPGTLYDDLIRRDFTLNSLAVDIETGNIIDICNGLDDLHNGILRTPLDAFTTLSDDPLRILRGFRFSITKKFSLDKDFWDAINNPFLWTKMMKVVSIERIRDELDKMFKANTLQTLEYIAKIKSINNEFYEYMMTKIYFKPIINNI